MPDINLIPVVNSPQQVVPRQKPVSVTQNVIVPSPFDVARATVAQKAQERMKSEMVNTPVVGVPLKPTLRYDNAELGYSVFNQNIEQVYGDNQSFLSQWGNNLLKFGANTLGSFAQTMADIPLAINAASKGDMSAMYDNDLTNGITDWLIDLETSLPNYQSTYERDHPVASYFNPATLGNSWGGVLKNLGSTVGMLAGTILTDAAIGSLTGGGGLGVLVPAQVAKISNKIGKALSVGKGGLAEIMANPRIAESVVENLIRRQGRVSAFRYGFNVFNASLSEATMGAAHTQRSIEDSSIATYRQKNGFDPEGTDRELIDIYARDGANAFLFADTAFHMMTNSIVFPSLLKPLGSAKAAAGAALADGTAMTIANNGLGAITRATATKGFKGFLNKIPSRLKVISIGEGIDEGGDFFIQRTAEDYYKRKYDVQKNLEVDQFFRSTSQALSDTFTTREGLENVFAGMLGGAAMHGVRRGYENARGIPNSRKAYADSAINALNTFTLDTTFTNSYESAVTSASIAADMEKALKSGDVFEYQNLKHQMLFNFISSASRVGQFDIRIEQLEALKGLEKGEFERMFGMDFSESNSKTVSSYVDAVIQKAHAINKDVKKVNELFVNPFKKGTKESVIYENFKDQLSFNFSEMRDNKSRVAELTGKLIDYNTNVDINSLINLTNSKGINKVVTDIQKTLDNFQDLDLIADPQLKAEYQVKKSKLQSLLDDLKNTSQQQDHEQFLKTLQNTLQYYNNDQQIDVATTLGMYNTATDIFKLGEAGRMALEQINFLSNEENFKVFSNQNSQILDAAEAAFNNAQAAEKGKTKEEIAEQRVSTMTTEAVTPEQAAAITELVATPQDQLTPEQEDLAEQFPQAVAKEIAKQNVIQELAQEESKNAEAQAQVEQVAQEAEAQETVTPEAEIIQATSSRRETMLGFNKGGMYKGFNPFFYLHKIFSAVFKDSTTNPPQDLSDAVFSGRSPQQLVAATTIVVKKSTQGNDGNTFSDVSGKTQTGKVFRKNASTDIEIYIDGKLVGLMQQPLFIDVNGNKIPMSEITEDIYESYTGNNKTTFQQFIKDTKAYEDLINYFLDQFAQGKTQFTPGELSSLIEFNIDYGQRTTVSKTSGGVTVNNMKLVGKKSAFLSVPVEFNEATGKYERGEPVVINEQEFTDRELTELTDFISTNKGIIQSTNSRFVLINRLPDGTFNHKQSIIAVRPANLGEAQGLAKFQGLQLIFDQIKNLTSATPSKEEVREFNKYLNQTIYITDPNNERGFGNSIRMFVNENGGIIINFWNVKNKEGGNIQISQEELANTKSFEDIFELANNQKSEAARKANLTFSSDNISKNTIDLAADQTFDSLAQTLATSTQEIPYKYETNNKVPKTRVYINPISTTPVNNNLAVAPTQPTPTQGTPEVITQPIELNPEVTNTNQAAPYGTIAADYLFTAGQGAILSSDYLIQALAGAFTKAETQIEAIRNKYFQQIIDANLGDLKTFIGTDLYNQMIAEVNDAINQTYNSPEVETLFNDILKFPSGLPAREGNRISIELDKINEGTIEVSQTINVTIEPYSEDGQAYTITVKNNGEQAGEITATVEDDGTMQISFASVTTPGLGIGTEAYTQLGDYATENGFILKSGNTKTQQSEAANKIWQKLVKQNKATKDGNYYFYGSSKIQERTQTTEEQGAEVISHDFAPVDTSIDFDEQEEQAQRIIDQLNSGYLFNALADEIISSTEAQAILDSVGNPAEGMNVQRLINRRQGNVQDTKVSTIPFKGLFTEPVTTPTVPIVTITTSVEQVEPQSAAPAVLDALPVEETPEPKLKPRPRKGSKVTYKDRVFIVGYTNNGIVELKTTEADKAGVNIVAKKLWPESFKQEKAPVAEDKEFDEFDNLPASDFAVIESILNMLSKKFGIKTMIVEDEGNWKGKVEGGVVYINKRTVTKDTPFHEVLHPLFKVMEVDNPKLYQSLLTQYRTLMNTNSTEQARFTAIQSEPAYSNLTFEEQEVEAMVGYLGENAAEYFESNSLSQIRDESTQRLEQKPVVKESVVAGTGLDSFFQKMWAKFTKWLVGIFHKFPSSRIQNDEVPYLYVNEDGKSVLAQVPVHLQSVIFEAFKATYDETGTDEKIVGGKLAVSKDRALQHLKSRILVKYTLKEKTIDDKPKLIINFGKGKQPQTLDVTITDEGEFVTYNDQQVNIADIDSVINPTGVTKDESAIYDEAYNLLKTLTLEKANKGPFISYNAVEVEVSEFPLTTTKNVLNEKGETVEVQQALTLQDFTYLFALGNISVDLQTRLNLFKEETFYSVATPTPTKTQAQILFEQLSKKVKSLQETAKREYGSDTDNISLVGTEISTARQRIAQYEQGLFDEATGETKALFEYLYIGTSALEKAGLVYYQIIKELNYRNGKEVATPTDKRLSTKELNIKLNMVRNLVAMYQGIGQVFQAVKSDMNDTEYRNIDSALKTQDTIFNNLQRLTTQVTAEFFWSSVQAANFQMQQLKGADAPGILTKDQLIALLKETNKDVDMGHFLFGATITSRDPIIALTAKIIKDEMNKNFIKEDQIRNRLQYAYSQYAQAKGLNEKTMQQYFKDNFLREALNYEATDEKDADGKTIYKYIKRWAYHEKYKNDEYDKDFREYIKSLGQAPELSDRDAYDAYQDKIVKWQLSNKNSAKYLNQDFAKLYKKDELFTELYDIYQEQNLRYGEAGLKNGIIPQIAKDEFKLYNKDKSVKENLKDKVKNAVTSKERVIEGEEVDVSYDYNKPDGTVYRSIRAPYVTQLLDEKDLSFSLVTDMALFSNASHMYGSLREMQPQLDNLKTLLQDNPNIRISARKTIAHSKGGKKIIDKIYGKHYDTQRLNTQLISFLNDVLYGETQVERNVSVFGKKISVNKVADNLGFLTAINSMALSILGPISNMVIGNIESIGEAVGGKYYKPVNRVNATKLYYSNTPEFMMDTNRIIKSKFTQLAIRYDAIQGEFRDKYGKKITGNFAQRYFNKSSLLFTTHIAEHQIQVTGMMALMDATKVHFKDGSVKSLHEAYVKDAKGFYELDKNAIWTEDQDLAFTNLLHGLSKDLNGNYSAFDKSMVQREAVGKLVMQYRKYLYTAWRARIGKQRFDYEKMTYQEGYYRKFMSTLYREVKEHKWAAIKNIGELRKTDSEFKYAMNKTMYHLGLFAGLSIIAVAVASGEDDNYEDKPWYQNMLLYTLMKARSDMGSFSTFALADLQRMYKNPAAVLITVDNYINFLSQLMHPFETYNVSGNGYEKGDSKLMKDFIKIIPFFRKIQQAANPEQLFPYFNLTGKNKSY